jgi:hypothetical protein
MRSVDLLAVRSQLLAGCKQGLRAAWLASKRRRRRRRGVTQRGFQMGRRLAYLMVVLTATVAVPAGMPSAVAAPSPGTVLTATVGPTSLTLSTGETVTVSGPLSVAITQFKVQGGKIVAVATLNGSLTGTTSSGDTVTATFTNTKVVLTVSNLQASCSAGTLSFDFRGVIPPSGLEVTVNGVPVSLKKAVVLRGCFIPWSDSGT